MASYLSSNITTATTTTVCSTGCVLRRIVVNQVATGGDIAYKDGSTTLGTIDATIANPSPYDLDIACPDSLVVVTGTGFDGDITVTYSLEGS